MAASYTAADVAHWMADEIARHGQLPQSEAAMLIFDQFGEEFLYINRNGNWALSPAVLKEFKKLTADTVVWSRRERTWRTRHADDPAGKRATDW